MNKNSVYVLRQPEHSLVTIIVVDTGDLPLKKKAHENIDALEKVLKDAVKKTIALNVIYK